MKTAQKHRTSTPSARRRATMYIMVLGTSLVVMAIGLGALNLARQARRDTANGQDFLEVQSYARSAIEVGLNLVRNTPTWRSTFAQGAWRTALPIGRGTYSLNVIDAVDGNFANNQDDMLLATGTGTIGQVQYKLAVNVAPYGPKGMDCLASAIHVASYFDTTKTVTVSAPISTNNWMKIRATGILNGDAEAVSTVDVEGTHNGTATEGIAAKEMPASTVFDYYLANGTVIPYASIPSGTMDRIVLTPTFNNVAGGLNAQGIYVISCGGAKILIKKCRIQGTLIILDPKSDSLIQEEINWETASATLPALLVRGSINFQWTGSLSETASSNTNFNPPNAPYQGNTDNDHTDVYPGTMKGLVYVSGDLLITGAESFDGALIVGGTVTTNAALSVTHDETIINLPPSGFEKPNRPMLPVAGTWTQIVN